MDAQEVSLTFTRSVADINRLNNWIFENIYPYIKGRTLELGSGSGEISSLFVERGLPLHLTDENDTNRENLRKKFEGIPAIRAIHDIKFNHPSFQRAYASGSGVFSTIIAVNIADHGCYENHTLHNAEHFLETKGHFMAITPAKAVLFNRSASNLIDLKEYNYKIARNLMGETFEILKVRYFDWSVDPESLSHNHSSLYTLAIFRKK